MRRPALACRTSSAGVRHLAFRRLLEGRQRELGGLTEEVLDWIEAYRRRAGAIRLRDPTLCPAAARPATAAGVPVRADRRSRALAAVVELAQREGYAGLTDLQIAAVRGRLHGCIPPPVREQGGMLPRRAGGAHRGGARLGAAGAEGATAWPESVHCPRSAFLEYLVAHRRLLRLGFVEPSKSGRRSPGT